MNGLESYELLSEELPVLYKYYILYKELLNVCTTIIKLFIIQTCIITTCTDLLIEILITPVIYVIQFSSDVLQMLVQELQDLLTCAEVILIMMQQTISDHYFSMEYSSLCQHS